MIYKPMTEKKLLSLFKKWKKLLKLEHWDIRLLIGSEESMTQEDGGVLLGTCVYSFANEVASITIRDLNADIWSLPSSAPNTDYAYEPEETLLHEFCHILVGPMALDGPGDRNNEELLEHSVCKLTKILMDLHRKG